MEGREKMVGSCGTCWSNMFGNIQEDIGYMLRRAVWIGDLPRFVILLVEAETMEVDDIIQDKLAKYSEESRDRTLVIINLRGIAEELQKN